MASLAIVRAVLPILANADFGDAQKRWRIAVQWSAVLMAGGLIAALVGMLLAPTCVALLFQRGDFTSLDTLRVSEAVRFGLVQIPFYCASIVLAQYVAATQRYSLFLWGNGLNLLVKVVANAVLIPRLGVTGAMLATAIMYAASMSFLWTFGRPGRVDPGPAMGGA
jgi:peptidoglycan biosynthesis protein MviN/MurJ (putative lipid II flippase)